MWRSLPLLCVLVLVLVGCYDPDIPRLSSPGVSTEEAIGVTRVDYAARASTRIAVSFARALPADATRAGRVILVAGGADAAELALVAKARAPAELRARMVPLFAWGEPEVAPRVVRVQPSRALPLGKSTLIMLFDRAPPWSFDLEIAQAELPAARFWPIGTASGRVITYCGTAPLPRDLEREVELSPSGLRASIVTRDDAPCIDVRPVEPRSALGPQVLPPSLANGAFAIDPSPVSLDLSPHGDAAVSDCPADAQRLGALCAPVDHDRLVFLGDDVSRLVFARVGPRSSVFTLGPGARHVVRGLETSTAVDVRLVVRDSVGEHAFGGSVRTRAARRHLVVNEVLARPPSGAPSQKFIELVNDGDRPLEMSGLVVTDGADTIELPKHWLAPGAYALITPEGYVDGLAGEIAPPPGVVRLTVDALRLTSEVAVIDVGDRVVSRIPASTSTRTVARGRRTPDAPDDAIDTFGFDATGRATPGRPNVIAPP